MARRRGLFQWGPRGSAQRSDTSRRVGKGVSPSTVSSDSGTSWHPRFSRCTCSGPPAPETPAPQPFVTRGCPLPGLGVSALMSGVRGECGQWQHARASAHPSAQVSPGQCGQTAVHVWMSVPSELLPARVCAGLTPSPGCAGQREGRRTWRCVPGCPVLVRALQRWCPAPDCALKSSSLLPSIPPSLSIPRSLR